MNNSDHTFCKAKEHKINIIIVNHGMEQIVDVSIFDKIIKVKKDIFSNIEIIYVIIFGLEV